MAFVTADRVQDTSTTTGTGNITVSGSAPSGYRALSTVLSVTDTFYYCVRSQTTGEWEVGIGTYSGVNIFARTTVLSSSNNNLAVPFSAGIKNVFLTLAATKTLQLGPTDAPAAGAIPYGTGSTLAYSPVGTAGLVLTSGGAGAPTWTVPASSTFTQTGAGAVTTTIDNKLRETALSAFDFMTAAQIAYVQARSRPTNATEAALMDVVAPLNAWFTACLTQNKAGYLPSGEYYVDSVLWWDMAPKPTQGFTLFGDGVQDSVISALKYTGADTSSPQFMIYGSVAGSYTYAKILGIGLQARCASHIFQLGQGTYTDQMNLTRLELLLANYSTSAGASLMEVNSAYGNVIAFNGVTSASPGKILTLGALAGGSGGPTGTVTITNASPAVFSETAHGLTSGRAVKFSTTGTLPAPLVAGTTYYVIATGLTANAFQVSATLGGAAINTTTAGSGTHTLIYASVTLTGGNGAYATADITVTSGAVTGTTIVSSGFGYHASDVLSAASADIGNVTSFTRTIATVNNTTGNGLLLKSCFFSEFTISVASVQNAVYMTNQCEGNSFIVPDLEIVSYCWKIDSANVKNNTMYNGRFAYYEAGVTATAGSDNIIIAPSIGVSNNQPVFAGGTNSVGASRQDATTLSSLQISAPASGGTVTMGTAIAPIRNLKLTTGTLATLTINLPANPGDGQEASIQSYGLITSLTLQGGGGSDVVFDAVTTLPAGTGVRYQYSAANVSWFRIA